MRKISLVALFAALVMSVNAADLWTGPKHVSWNDGGVQIAATSFADAKAGDKIVVSYTAASDGIEFKVMNDHFDHLAGSREAAWIGGDGAFEQFLTQSAVDSLKAYGLEIIGANFTCSKVELLEGKAELKEGFTVWTGYFWVDDEGGWKTLELYWNGFAGVDWDNATALRIYTEAKGTDYIINVKENWEEAGQIAGQDEMTDGEGYKELALTEDLRNKLANAERWMIQFSHKELDKFNVTDVVLVGDFGPDDQAIDNTQLPQMKSLKLIENGQLVIIKNGVKYNALGTEIK